MGDACVYVGVLGPPFGLILEAEQKKMVQV